LHPGGSAAWRNEPTSTRNGDQHESDFDPVCARRTVLRFDDIVRTRLCHITYSGAYGNAQRTTSATAPYGNAHPTINSTAPVLGRFAASDFGFSEHGRPRERLHAPGRVPDGGYGGYSRYADYGAFGYGYGYGYGYLPDNYATYCGQFPKAC
jgi:hypothetical protein